MPELVKVLLVEDHPPTRAVLSRMIARAGYEVFPADSPDAALKVLDTIKFDLVVSDIGLPAMSGWELMERIKAKQPWTRAIALSGFGYDEDRAKSTKAGFDDHMTKPVAWSALSAKISKLCPPALPPPPAKIDGKGPAGLPPPPKPGRDSPQSPG